MDELISTLSSDDVGYRVLMDFEAWRIGYMRHGKEYEAENIRSFQRHENCDEVFVLLRGHCCLLAGDGTDTVGTIYAKEMEPLRIYNIHRGVWHSHLVDEDSDVLVVENSDVTLDNSPMIPLTLEQRMQIIQIQSQRK